MHKWLHVTALCRAAGASDDAAPYRLGDADIERLLDLARVAADESGGRTDAPLLTPSPASPWGATRTSR